MPWSLSATEPDLALPTLSSSMGRGWEDLTVGYRDRTRGGGCQARKFQQLSASFRSVKSLCG